MIGELCEDNQQLTRALRATHEVCDRHNDVATASLIENWIDESERRTWFLAEIVTRSLMSRACSVANSDDLTRNLEEELWPIT